MPGKRLTPNPQWATRYRNGESIIGLAESAGVSYTGMRNALTRMGVQLRPPSKCSGRIETKRKRYRATYTNTENLLIALLKHGSPMTAQQLADAVSLTRIDIWVAMNRITSKPGLPLVEAGSTGRRVGAEWLTYELTERGRDAAEEARKRPVLHPAWTVYRYVTCGHSVTAIAGTTFSVRSVRRFLAKKGVQVGKMPIHDTIGEEWKARYEAGESIYDIAADRHDYTTVRRTLIRAGANMRTRSPIIRRPEWKRRYEEGESIRDLAESVGVSYSGMRNILASLGVEFRRRGYAAGPRDD